MADKNEVEMRSYSQQLDEQSKMIDEFNTLLSTIENLDQKKKVLWIHIYRHAMEDRSHAYMLFTELFVNTRGKPSEAQLSGATFAKYIERMSKSNDQLLKLAELIQNAQSEKSSPEKSLSEDEIYAEISKQAT